MTQRSQTPTKQTLLLDLLSRPEGATLGQIMDATGWQKHSVRGFISGFIKKKKGLTVISEKTDGGERIYHVTEENKAETVA
jgi:hypothetical protein